MASYLSSKPYLVLTLCSAYISLISAHGRIKGAIETRPNEYIVSVNYNRLSVCSGSLISRKHVLTAAHCIWDDVRFYTIRAGAMLTYIGGVVRQVVKATIHPKYNRDTYADDVAILQLETDVIGPNIQPITMSQKTPPKGAIVKVSGWGRIIEDYTKQQPELRSIEMKIVPRHDCSTKWRYVERSMICIVGAGSLCDGDSGGPIVYNGTLCGISLSFNSCTTAGFPSVITNVVAVKNFIARAMAD